jgi:hypothetical protein
MTPILLLQSPALPGLPWWAVLLFVGLTAFMSWLNNRGWKNTAAQRKETIDDMRGQLDNLHKEKTDAYKELADVKSDRERLKAKTDLTPVIEIVQQSQTQQAAYFEQGRQRFEQALDEVKLLRQDQQAHMNAILEGFKTLTKDNELARRTQSDAYSRMIESLEHHLSDDQAAHREDMEHKQSFLTILKNLEAKSSAQAELVSAIRDATERSSTQRGKSRQQQ